MMNPSSKKLKSAMPDGPALIVVKNGCGVPPPKVKSKRMMNSLPGSALETDASTPRLHRPSWPTGPTDTASSPAGPGVGVGVGVGSGVGVAVGVGVGVDVGSGVEVAVGMGVGRASLMIWLLPEPPASCSLTSPRSVSLPLSPNNRSTPGPPTRMSLPEPP